MNITDKLDALADFQAQVDYLEMQKRELLDAVKIPDEVLAAQDEANKERQRLQAAFFSRLKTADEMKRNALAAILDPELPPEYMAALEKAKNERAVVELSYAEMAAQAARDIREANERIDAALQEQIRDVYRQVEIRKQEINAEFAGKAEAAQQNIAKLTAEIKEDVIAGGQSVKGQHYQAVYVKGRVTWNTDMLDGMIVAIPALAKARKEGTPSVSIRRI